MNLNIYVVDAFAERPFEGNPAGVCVVTSDLDVDLMQKIALEMNHAETAFLVETEPNIYKLRWFTPTQEVPLCGHATLASAHVLWSTGRAKGTLTFRTLSGELNAEQADGKIVLDFPSDDPTAIADVQPFETTLGVSVVQAGESKLFWIAELESEAAVRQLEPSMDRIASLGKVGIIVTAKSQSDQQDFVSRMFAPSVGVPEDPVTGSAHCVLAPYWSQKLGELSLIGYQASPRGGFVGVEVNGHRVLLKGTAVTTLAGELFTKS